MLNINKCKLNVGVVNSTLKQRNFSIYSYDGDYSNFFTKEIAGEIRWFCFCCCRSMNKKKSIWATKGVSSKETYIEGERPKHLKCPEHLENMNYNSRNEKELINQKNDKKNKL